MRFPRATALYIGAIAALSAVYACTDLSDVSSPGHPRAIRLGLAPSYSYLTDGSYVGEPINRIRLTARNEANEVVGTLIRDVSPDNQQWELALEVNIETQTSVVVTIELINVTGGVEAVQWSGLSAPITVTPTQTVQPTAPVQLFQGPLENLAVKSVRISGGALVLEEGANTQFTATIDGPPSSAVVWNSRDAGIVAIAQDGRATAVRSGTTYIVAIAGPKRDSVAVQVSQHITSIVITPDTQRIAALGTNAAFSARVLDLRGGDVTGAAVTWSIADANIADNLGNGQFRAKANGSTQITATSTTSPSVRGTATLVVTQRAAGLDVTPAVATLTAVGARQTFNAAIRDGAGNPLTQSVRWRSSNSAVATIDAAGVATATGVGTTEISAVTGTGPDTIVGRASLQVTQNISALTITPPSVSLEALGDSALFTLVARDANNNVVPNVRASWSSANPLIVSIDSTGRARALNNGAAVITAQVGEIRANASIAVQQRVTAVGVAPAATTLTTIGQQLVLTATATDRRNHAVTGRRALWSSSDSTIASVDTAGRVTARRNGTATVRALIDSVAGSANVTVAQAGPSSVAITPDSAFINAIGFSTQLNATAFDANHLPMPNVRLGWSSLDPTIAMVDSAGRVTAAAVGRARIVAGANPADTAAIVVRQIAAQIALTLPNSALALNGQVVASATVKDSNAVVLPGAAVTWSSSDTTVAAVNANGRVTARRAGSASITATFGGLSGSVNVSVAAPDLAVLSLTMTPADTVVEDDSTLFSITIKNIGNAPANSSHMTVQFVDAGSHTVIGDSTVTLPPLAAGQEFTLARYLHVGGGDGPDSVFARVVADTLNEVAEANEANNSATTPVVHIRKLLTNLQPRSVAIMPDSLMEGSAFSVSASLRVARSTSDTSSIRVRLLDAANGNVLLTRTFAQPPLPPADSMPFVFPLNADTTIAWPDSIEAEVTFDQSNRIVETDEADNVITSAARRVHLGVGVVTVAPDTIRLNSIGAVSHLSSTVFDKHGRMLHGRRVNYFSTNPGVATIDSTGTITSHGVGSAGLVANSEGRADTATIIVGQVTANLTVTPSALTLLTNDTVRLHADATDSSGISIFNANVAWSSDNPAVATVDSTGLVRAVGAGHARILGSYNGVAGVADITVNAANLTFQAGSIAVAPDTAYEVASVVVSGTIKNTGDAAAPPSTIRLRVLNAFNDSAVFSTTVQIPGVPAHDSLPLAYPVVVGAIPTLPDSVRGEATLDANGDVAETSETDNVARTRVVPVRFAVASLDITPNTRSIVLNAIGDTAHITAIPRDRYGRALARPVAFVPLQSDTASVDAAGVVTAVRAGSALIIVQSETRIDTVHVAVSPVVSSLELLSGDNQDGTVDQEPHDSLGVRALDASGHGVANVAITWTPGAGQVAGSSLDFLAAGLGFSPFNAPLTTHTNADGVAVAHWKFGTSRGQHTLTACAPSVPCVTFHGNARADKAFKANKRGESDEQEVVVNRIAPNALELTVLDKFDNPTRGTVEWSLQSGHGTFTSPSTVAIDTLTGRATVTWQLPTARGRYTVNYTVKNEDGATVATGDFKATAKPDKPTHTLKGQNSDDQVVTVAQTAPNALELFVSDTFGNAIEGANVTWALRAGYVGQSLSAHNTTTDSLGRASVTWDVGTAAGHVFVDYSVSRNDSIFATGSFKARARAGKARNASKHGGDNQDVTVAQIAPNALELSVVDEYGNPTRGNVHWTVGLGHGVVASEATPIDSLTGLATVTWTMPQSKGAHVIDYVVKDESDSTVATGSFHANAKPDKPTQQLRKNPGKSKHGAKVALQLTDTLEYEFRDQYGNTVDNAPVTWSYLNGDNSSVSGQSMTNSDGTATGFWVLGTKAGGHGIHVRVGSGADTIGFNVVESTVPAGPKQKGASTGSNQNIVVKKSSAALTVEVKDEFGNLVPYAKIAWQRRDTSEAFSPDTSVTNALGVATTIHTGRRTKGGYTITGFVLDSANQVIDSVQYLITTKADVPASVERTNAGRSKHGSTVGVNLTDTVTVRFRDQYGNTVENEPVSWSKLSGDSSALGVFDAMTDSAGLVTGQWLLGKKAGKHRIKIQAGAAEVTLEDSTATGPVKKLHLSHPAVSLDALLDSSTVVTSAPSDEFDNPVSVSATYASSDTTRMSVSNGKIKSKKNGNAYLRVTAGDFTDSIPVTVAQRVKFLEINERHDTITALQFKKKLTQTQRDANHQAISDSLYRSTVTWVSRNPEFATFVGDSLLSVSNGTATVVAIATVDNTVLDSVFVEISQAANVSGIRFTLANGDSIVSASTLIGDSVKIIAHAIDDRGNPVTRYKWSFQVIEGTSPVTITAPGGGQVRDSIVWVHGVGSGLVTIKAQDAKGSHTGSFNLTVLFGGSKPMTPVKDRRISYGPALRLQSWPLQKLSFSATEYLTS